MDEIEFLPTIDVLAEEANPLPPRPGRRRWAQPLALAVLAGAGTMLVVIHPDGRHADGRQPATQPSLGPVPTVHVQTYLPWHERAITGGFGAYIY